MTRHKLTLKEKKFCTEFLRNGGNASQAYRDAYDVAKTTKLKTIGNEATRLLARPGVARCIERLRETLANKGIMQADEVLQRLTYFGRKKKLHPIPIKALELLGKNHKLFTEKVENTGNALVKETIIIVRTEGPKDGQD